MYCMLGSCGRGWQKLDEIFDRQTRHMRVNCKAYPQFRGTYCITRSTRQILIDRSALGECRDALLWPCGWCLRLSRMRLGLAP